MLSAKQIMNPVVIELERGTLVSSAADIMVKRHVGSVIVTAGDYPVGILTETDIAKMISAGKSPITTKVEEIMSSPLFSTTPDADMTQIANTMTSNKIKKMPVVEHQRVIGIITQTDIVKHILRVCSHIHEEYTKGKMNSIDFATCSAELYSQVRSSVDSTKHWHMRCTSCGHQFLAEERDGKLLVEACPKCNGQIEYDPTPPL